MRFSAAEGAAAAVQASGTRRSSHSSLNPSDLMEQFFQQLTNGLAVGGIYALIALGYTMVYGVLKLINFAHGDLFTYWRLSRPDPADLAGADRPARIRCWACWCWC